MRGKDVIIAFVESYGQVAVRGTSFSPGVDAVLRQRTGMLARAGWSAQSAWLTSPTFGGISWLAHSTLQSGLWVNSTQRYAEHHRQRGGADHDVPISIVARDPSVFRQIASWHWQDGLLPGPGAPLEPMDAFRNQFLGAFSTASSRAAPAPGSAAPDAPR